MDLNAADYDQRTALHLSVQNKSPKIIELLYFLGAKKDL